MPYKQHFIEFYKGNQLHRQRLWANENQNLFPEYGFKNKQSDFPTTHCITNRLVVHYKFTRIENEVEVIVRNTDRHFKF